jgi:aspartyl-tRNA(Asn)/glutamyl-tRNA(Gln) amidotransferase subunit A
MDGFAIYRAGQWLHRGECSQYSLGIIAPMLCPFPPRDLPDLVATRSLLRSGHSRAAEMLEKSIASAQAPAAQHSFVRTLFDEARAAAGTASPSSPLAGLAVSVKDLFDVAGQTTAAGSTVLASAPAVLHDCTAVARLRAAGGVVLGRTHMVEFAFGGVGTNPHFPTPANVADAQTPRIPGGSSSGAAVSVASGAAYIGLGSDTGGSIRIPAALNGIVGFKSTARLVPTDGALPLSTTLDTVCAMTRSVRDAVVAHEVLTAHKVTPGSKPLSAHRLAVATSVVFDGIEPAVAAAFDRSLNALHRAGAQIEEIALPELSELAPMQAAGSIAAAEAYAWHRDLLAQHGAQYDPRVASRMQRGAAMTAADYICLLAARRDWITRVEQRLAPFDAVLSPTVPIVAPSIASVLASDGEYFRVNALLLRNTTVVNMLDGCAISIPCQAPGDLPVGLMLWHGALHDDAILHLALLAEQTLR